MNGGCLPSGAWRASSGDCTRPPVRTLWNTTVAHATRRNRPVFDAAASAGSPDGAAGLILFLAIGLLPKRKRAVTANRECECVPGRVTAVIILHGDNVFNFSKSFYGLTLRSLH